jgi:SRSO17 transposase
MRSTTRLESTASSEEQELSVISQGWQALAELSERIGSHVRRAEVRRRLQRYLQGLLASVERKNGWQLAEALGEANAHGVQRLLAEADWDEEAVRDELRAYVLAHLGAEQAVLVVDETGFREVWQKIGRSSAAVQWDGWAT